MPEKFEPKFENKGKFENTDNEGMFSKIEKGLNEAEEKIFLELEKRANKIQEIASNPEELNKLSLDEIKKLAEELKELRKIEAELKKKEKLLEEGWTLEGELTEKDAIAEIEIENPTYYVYDEGYIKDITFSPDGRKIVIMTVNSLRFFHLTEMKGKIIPVRLFTQEKELDVRDLKFSPDGENIIVGHGTDRWSEPSAITIFHLSHKGVEKVDKFCLQPLGSHWPQTFEFFPGWENAIVGGSCSRTEKNKEKKGYLMFVSLKYFTKDRWSEKHINTEEARIQYFDGPIYAISLTLDGKKGVIVERKKEESSEKVSSIIHIASFDKGFKILTNFSIDEVVLKAKLSLDGEKLIVGSEKGLMQIFSLAKQDQKGNIIPEVIAEFKSDKPISAVNFSLDEKRVAIGIGAKEGRVLIFGKK
jgi:WD40 repeat protein